MHVGNLRSMFAKRKASVLESQEVRSSPEEDALAWSVDVEPIASPKLFASSTMPKPPPALLSKQEQKFYNRCKDLLKNMEGLELQQHQTKLMEMKTYYEEIQKRGRVLFVPGSNAEIYQGSVGRRCFGDCPSHLRACSVSDLCGSNRGCGCLVLRVAQHGNLSFKAAV